MYFSLILSQSLFYSYSVSISISLYLCLSLSVSLYLCLSLSLSVSISVCLYLCLLIFYGLLFLFHKTTINFDRFHVNKKNVIFIINGTKTMHFKYFYYFLRKCSFRALWYIIPLCRKVSTNLIL